MQDSEARRGKIKLTIGEVKFSGEGDQDWLGQQVTRLIDVAPKVQVANSTAGATSTPEPSRNGKTTTESLATYLKTKGADKVQTQRFLATAAWLQRRGESELTTRAVTKALQDNQQKRLGNASDCLNQNVSRGLCEKTANGFFITPEGLKHLGEVED